MEIVNAEQLHEIMPNAKQENILLYQHGINKVFADFEINTPLRVVHFLAQIAHESGSLRYVSENLNYSAKALRAVFGKYFPIDSDAEEFARQPEKIANRVYANRMGNGDEASGDGWRYHGRGLIQLTGKDNYRHFAQSVGKNTIARPDLLQTDPDLAVAAAGWYWDSRNLNAYADHDDIREITRRINGGYHGLEDRQQYLTRAKSVLGV
ncbi:glycoside hydrolase family 19 protein [Oceanospirillum beijerinckii]|uniref:glycoside hydrolase family 19 protein n=1 Tax=Oceanospirillum beijerinckii TaxID=64976 RepID=UPI00042458F6|nr:glycoside hydrolase family 19 protein [Oceanospirillum beijerinckii]MAC47336.1 glycoside hydrolase family 19 [Oceanospirillum sp.]